MLHVHVGLATIATIVPPLIGIAERCIPILSVAPSTIIAVAPSLNLSLSIFSIGSQGVGVAGKERWMPEHPVCWFGLYKGQYDLWGPESYSHPLDKVKGLCYYICGLRKGGHNGNCYSSATRSEV